MRYSMMKYVLIGLVLQTLVTLFAGGVYASPISITTEPGESPYFLQSVVGPLAEYSNFGSAVSSWKDNATGIRWAVVGAPSANAAYVFHLDEDAKQWRQDVQLAATDAVAGDMFGAAVAIYGDTIAVGAPGHKVGTHANSGRVYVYSFNSATYTASFQSTVDGNPADNAGTGTSVAVVGNTLMAGAPNASSHGAVWVATRSGSTWTFVQQLDPLSASGFTFGKSLAFDGSRLVIGMPNDSTTEGDSAGSAFTFQFNGSSWVEEQKLLASDGLAFDHFGSSVALYQDTIAIGARDHDHAAGAVYSFKFARIDRQWLQKSILSETNGFQFGISVSLSNGLLAVGSAFNSGTAASLATVYIGSADNWQQINVSLPDPQQGDPGKPVFIDTDLVLAGTPDYNEFTSSVYRDGVWQALQDQAPLATDTEVFGQAVAVSGNVAAFDSYPGKITLFSYDATGVWRSDSSLIRSEGASAIGDVFCPNLFASGDTLIVGDPTQDVGSATSQGAFYVYNNFHEVPRRSASVINPTGSSNDHFGCSVAISGNRLVVGAPHENRDAGAVYVFVNNAGSWSMEQVLTAPMPVGGSIFGAAVAISGDTVMVGSPNYSPGTVFIFERSVSGWSLQKQLVAPGGMAGDHFGAPLSISGNTLAVGATRRDHGSVLVYTGAASSWNLQQEIAGGSGDSFFGWSLAIAGDQLAVGAEEPAHVSIYTRKNGAWKTHATITSNGEPNEEFSRALALANGVLAVGAPTENGGRGYLFRDDGIFKDGFD